MCAFTHPPYTSAQCSFPNRSRVVRYVPSLPTVFDTGPRVFVGALGPQSQSMTIATTIPIDEPFHCIASPIRRDWAVGRLMCVGLRQGCPTRSSTADGVGWRVVPLLGRLWTGPNRSEGCRHCLWLRRGSGRIVRRIASGVGGRFGLGEWVGWRMMQRWWWRKWICGRNGALLEGDSKGIIKEDKRRQVPREHTCIEMNNKNEEFSSSVKR